MSRYAVDKVMREIIQSAAAREAFAADAAAYLGGRDLTGAERSALAERAFTELYKLGAHPFLLVGFVSSLAPPAERLAAMTEYQKTLTTLGYPDFGT